MKRPLLLLAFSLSAGLLQAGNITARQVIERLKEHSGIPWQEKTVDTFKTGDPDAPVKGIAVCMMPTYQVLQDAAAAGANLVIAHEPTFWGHYDATEPMASENDAVLAAKQAFIKEHGLVIFRFHDHIHQMKPDMIVHGVTTALGWEQRLAGGSTQKYDLPPTTVGALAAQIKATLGIRALRVVGDPAMKVTKVAFSPGFSGFALNRHLLQDDSVDVLVLGEDHEWETIEYGADAIAAGRRKALIVMSHVPSEEAGMQECAAWLRTFVTEVPIHFIKTPEPFWIPDR